MQARFVHAHIHLAITGQCFAHSLHSREYSHSGHANNGHRLEVHCSAPCAPPLYLVAHDCWYPLSRYTCRATRVAADFLDFIAFCRCSTGIALHPLKILGSHLAPPLSREVSHRNLGLKRCRATRGCRSYSCGCRVTLCN